MPGALLAAGAPIAMSAASLRFATPTQPKCLSIVTLGNGDIGRRVKRTFTRVTAITVDDQRALIYLVGQDGLKILRETPAPDPQVEREFEKPLK